MREEGSEGRREGQGKETSISLTSTGCHERKCRMYVLQVLNIPSKYFLKTHTLSLQVVKLEPETCICEHLCLNWYICFNHCIPKLPFVASSMVKRERVSGIFSHVSNTRIERVVERV